MPAGTRRSTDRLGERGRGDREFGQIRTPYPCLPYIVIHLLKPQASPASEPTRGWRDTIRRARREIERRLKDSPSLRGEVADTIADELGSARTLVRADLQDHGERPLPDLDTIGYSESQVLGDWLP